MKNKVAINGRIFEYQITGVGRFCYEVIKEIDKMEDADKFILLVSKKAMNLPRLEKIKIKKVGNHEGIFWEQIELPLYMYKHHLKCLSMSSSLPLIKPDAVLIHDISLKVNGSYANNLKERIKLLWPRLQYWIAVKFASVLFTDSEFQKEEIRREYNTNREIYVVYCGWQHMNKIEDSDIVDKLKLEKNSYYFAVATKAKNKNFEWIINAAKTNTEDTFVIAGKLDTKYFADSIKLDKQDNIITVGYIADEEMKSLMKYSKAFIYPSIYEGFGIPPLEALAVGTKAIVGNASCLPEIYGGSVYYIDVTNADVNLNNILKKKVDSPETILEKYSWEKTARYIVSKLNIK